MTSNNRIRIPVSKDDHSQGKEDAPLVLVEYGDYECPFCGQAYSVVKQIQQDLRSDLHFVFRNFPLTIAHPHAMDAARAAEAAGMQNKFIEMHNLLFENQRSLDHQSLLKYAAMLNLDLERFRQDMNSKKVEEKIAQDFYGGTRSGVNGTPTFFINGFRYEGDWSYPVLLATLTKVRDRLLEEVFKKAA